VFDTLGSMVALIQQETQQETRDLRERVTPVALAHQQTIAVAPGLADLFSEQALVRGRTLACTGTVATSTAVALVAAAVAQGAWLAVIDVPTLGLDAAREAGIALERVVAVNSGSAMRWPDVVAAAVDGFDLVLACVPPPPQLSAGSARKVATRIRQRGAVVVVVGDPGLLPCDGVIESTAVVWSGLGDGYGHLRQRTVELRASGRRLPGRRRCRLEVGEMIA
jgi:hypothetical protein